MIKITIKLQAWKISIELDRTLMTLQDSLGSVSNPCHDSTASAKKMITWQAHWQIANVLHFWRKVYFVLSLKQLRRIHKLKMIPAKALWAAFTQHFLVFYEQVKLLVVAVVFLLFLLQCCYPYKLPSSVAMQPNYPCWYCETCPSPVWVWL